jgi:outer membrane protein TolC
MRNPKSMYRAGCSELPLAISWLALSLLFGSGCSNTHYRRSADKEVYGIIQKIDKQVFGRTNVFTIDTPFSGRDPKTIPPSEIIAERTATNRLILNLDQALDLALKNSREFQTQKEQLYLSALTLTGAKYAFSPQFFGNSTVQFAGTTVDLDTASVSSRLGVNQLAKTGGQLSMALANDILSYYTGNQPRSIINTLSVNLAQPILRSFGRNNPNVENLTQAQRDVLYALRSFHLYEQQFAVDTVIAYFGLLTRKDMIRNYYQNYTNRVETTKYLEERSVDRAPQSDVDDARTAELGARINYINALASYLNLLDVFKLRLGLPLSQELYLDDRDLKELIDAGVIPVEISRQSAFRLCVEQHMDILNSIDRFEDSKRKVRVAANQLRADLNLLGSASLASTEPEDYLNFDPNKVRYTAGIRLDLPLDRLRERNNYRATLVSFESQLRSLGLTLDSYKDRIDRGLRTVEQARLNNLNGVESLKVAERRVDNDTMRLETGRATIRDLRESQDTLIRAQNDLITTYTDYLTARLEMMLNIGIIDTRPKKFWLSDPLRDRLTPELRGVPPLRMPEDRVLPPESFIEPAS